MYSKLMKNCSLWHFIINFSRRKDWQMHYWKMFAKIVKRYVKQKRLKCFCLNASMIHLSFKSILLFYSYILVFIIPFVSVEVDMVASCFIRFCYFKSWLHVIDEFVFFWIFFTLNTASLSDCIMWQSRMSASFL